MNRPIRIAQVIGITGCGGVESFVMNYYEHIDRNKVQFDFLVESTSKIIDEKKISEMGGKVIIIPSYKNPFRYMRELKRIFLKNHYDIVHSNMNTLSFFSLRAAKKAGVKVRIAHSHSTSNSKEHLRNLIKLFLRPLSKIYATHYFACSEKAGKWLFGNRTFKKRKVIIINNAIDTERFSFSQKERDRIRNSLNLNSDLVIGNVGRFVPQKNHEFLIDIFNNIQKKRSDVKLILLGDGPLYQQLKNQIEKYKISNKVLFLGAQEHPESFYQAMDCFVMTSLYEGLPLVAIEAQANGLKCFLSSEITDEVKVLDSTKFIDIRDKDLELWTNEIINTQNFERTLNLEALRNSKFNICGETEKMQELYELLLKQNTKECNGGGVIFCIWSNFVSNIVIGHVGRFMKQKNHEFLIEIFERIHKEVNSTKLLLIGSGPLQNKIQNSIKKKNLLNAVILAGDHADIEKYYSAMDLFVFPSLYEGLGMSLIEAQCSNLYCYVSKAIPAEAIMNDNIKYIDNFDVNVWSDCVIDCIKKKDYLSEREKNRMNEKYDIQKQAKKLTSLYVKMCSFNDI